MLSDSIASGFYELKKYAHFIGHLSQGRVPDLDIAIKRIDEAYDLAFDLWFHDQSVKNGYVRKGTERAMGFAAENLLEDLPFLVAGMDYLFWRAEKKMPETEVLEGLEERIDIDLRDFIWDLSVKAADGARKR